MTADYTRSLQSPTPTAVCKTNQSPCPEFHEAGTAISGSLQAGTKAVLSTNVEGISVSCSKSSVEGKLTENPGFGTVAGDISASTWGECTRSNGGSCLVEPLDLSWTANFEHGASGNGSLWIGPHAGGARPGVRLKSCGVLSNCVFRASEGGAKDSLKLSFSGGESPTASAKDAALTTSAACGSSGKGNLTYAMSPTPMWLEAAPYAPFYVAFQ
jgi:hypothetical protein